MLRHKAMMLAAIGTIFTAGVQYAGAQVLQSSTQSKRTQISVQTSQSLAPQVGGVPYDAKGPKSCTYRGGPKSNIWECR